MNPLLLVLLGLGGYYFYSQSQSKASAGGSAPSPSPSKPAVMGGLATVVPATTPTTEGPDDYITVNPLVTAAIHAQNAAAPHTFSFKNQRVVSTPFELTWNVSKSTIGDFLSSIEPELLAARTVVRKADWDAFQTLQKATCPAFVLNASEAEPTIAVFRYKKASDPSVFMLESSS